MYFFDITNGSNKNIVVTLFIVLVGIGLCSSFTFDKRTNVCSNSQLIAVEDKNGHSYENEASIGFVQSHNSRDFISSKTDSAVNINKLLGAERFYQADFSGQDVIQAAIGGGLIWNKHETVNHVDTYIRSEVSKNEIPRHATSVGHLMGGRSQKSTYPENYFQFGIAFGAELWSGATRARPLPFTKDSVWYPSIKDDPEGWKKHYQAVPNVYKQAVEKGADIINSSWGYLSLGYYDFADTISEKANCTDRVTVGLDALISENPSIVFVSSAGNAGNIDRQTFKEGIKKGKLHAFPERPVHGVFGPALGFNDITVGALKYDTLQRSYEKRAALSGYGPGRFYHAGKDTVLKDVRATVDIMAPGQGMKMATKGGVSKYRTGKGTSFAAPIVSGGATLLVNAAQEIYGNDPQSTDARLIRSILMNSAKKIPGWDNGQQKNEDGTIVTTQALDWKLGAGRLDLNRAFDNFVHEKEGGKAGTANVKDSKGPSEVAPVGWDVNKIEVNTSNQYSIKRELEAGSELTVTLNWFVDRETGSMENFKGASEERFSHLTLRVVKYNNGSSREIIDKVAASISKYNSLQHLSFKLPEDGFYGIEVTYEKDLWNFTDNPSTRVYGLSWFNK